MDSRLKNICNNPAVSDALKASYGCPNIRTNAMRQKLRKQHKMPSLPGGGAADIDYKSPGMGRVGPVRRKLAAGDIGTDPGILPPGVGGISDVGRAGLGGVGGQAVAGGGVLSQSADAFEPIELISGETMQGLRQGISTYFSGGYGGAAAEEGGLEMSDIPTSLTSVLDYNPITRRGTMPEERINPYENLEPPSIPDPVVEPEPVAELPEVPESVMSSIQNLFGEQATATMEAVPETTEATMETGLLAEETADVAIDLSAYATAETTAIGMGAVEGAGEAGLTGFAAEAGAEAAGEAAIGGAAAIAGEEAGVAAGALAGGLALGPETLGASIVIGGLIAGITAIFAGSKRKFDPKHPQAYRVHGGKEGRDLAKKFDKDPATKKYADWIRDPNQNVFLVVLDKLGDNGKHIVQVVKQMDADGLAQAQATLERNPDAYKGYDPSVLKALGLNPNLSTQSWDKDPKSLWRDDGITQPTDEQISKANTDIDKLNTDLTNLAIFKKNKKLLDDGTYKGTDKDAMLVKLKQFAFDNHIDFDSGKLMTPDQISKLDPNSRVKDFVAPKITGKDIMDKMRKKLGGDQSVEFSQSEMNWLTSQGWVDGKSNNSTLDMINQNLIYKASMDKYNQMPDGTDKKYFYQQVQGWLWDHNMNPDGTYMNPDQIKNKGTKPPAVPPDVQKSYDENKAKYDKDKADYDKAYADYQDKLDKYKSVRDLLDQRDNLHNQLVSKYGKGEDTSDVQKQIDDLNDQIGAAMSGSKDTPSQPDPKQLHAAVAPIRRQQAIKQVASNPN